MGEAGARAGITIVGAARVLGNPVAAEGVDRAVGVLVLVVGQKRRDIVGHRGSGDCQVAAGLDGADAVAKRADVEGDIAGRIDRSGRPVERFGRVVLPVNIMLRAAADRNVVNVLPTAVDDGRRRVVGRDSPWPRTGHADGTHVVEGRGDETCIIGRGDIALRVQDIAVRHLGAAGDPAAADGLAGDHGQRQIVAGLDIGAAVVGNAAVGDENDIARAIDVPGGVVDNLPAGVDHQAPAARRAVGGVDHSVVRHIARGRDREVVASHDVLARGHAPGDDRDIARSGQRRGQVEQVIDLNAERGIAGNALAGIGEVAPRRGLDQAERAGRAA